MNLDAEELHVIARDECIELLKSAPIGRIIYTYQALPAIRPVRFSLVGGAIFVPTRAGSPLAVAAQDAVVAFQADQYDACERTGWSVTMVGHATLIPIGDDSPPRLRACCDVLRIAPEQVCGHWIPRGTSC
jgi:uncharacterized protein